MHQNEAGPLWITSLLLNIVTISLLQCSTFEWEHASLFRKILLTVLWATSSLQFSLPHHLHDVYLLNPLSWYWSDNKHARDEEVKTAEMKWLKEWSTEFYEAGIYALIRSEDIISERNSDYVKK